MTKVFDFLNSKNRRTSHSIDKTIERLFDVTEEYSNLYIKYSSMKFPVSHHITLAYNYALILVEISEDVENHFQFINTLPVDDRIDYHNETANGIKIKLETIRNRAEKFSNSGKEIDVNSILSSERDIPALQSLKIFAEKAGQPMLEESINLFKFTYMIIDAIIERFETLANLRLTREDRDYHDLFKAFQNYYYLSDDWRDVQNQYITKLYKIKRIPEHPSISDVENCYYEELCKIYDDDTWKDIYDADNENFSNLTRNIIQKLHYDSPEEVLPLVKMLGKLNMLTDWMEELKEKKIPYEPIPEDEEAEMDNGFSFKDIFAQKRFDEALPQIMKYMEGKNAVDWCCLHHVLICRGFIDYCDFADFIRWLNSYVDKEIMKEDNIRKVKSDYFVKTTETWTIDDYKKEKDTTQSKTRYEKYIRYYDDLESILIKISI